MGFPRKDVAEALGITVQAYGNYELGHKEPRMEMIVAIADLFDVTTDALLLHGKTA
ncbi:helix-turn-helix domain-containing protein [Selenomonas ruminantium]|uniref:helix-turn-helix domain-containing protein n=1 Tax=Selenomonas ruminantium TaxID=971 RepID=UPI0009442B2E|nr:helix-turn-helix transcriptional regulator [Selenomonas ruminantium]